MNREATQRLRQVRPCWTWWRALGEPRVEANARTHSVMGGTPRRHELGRKHSPTWINSSGFSEGFRWKKGELGWMSERLQWQRGKAMFKARLEPPGRAECMAW